MSKPKQKKAADNRPIHEIRHRQIRAAIWPNPTEKGVMYSVTVSRSYKDKDGKWHDTQSFRFDDLLTVAKALTDAHSIISTMMSRDRAASRAGERPVKSDSPR
jgi:hypothetical protein